MHRPGVELAIFRSLVRSPNHYITEPTQLNYVCLTAKSGDDKTRLSYYDLQTFRAMILTLNKNFDLDLSKVNNEVC